MESKEKELEDYKAGFYMGYAEGFHTGTENATSCEHCKHKGKWEIESGNTNPCRNCRRRDADNYEPAVGSSY